MTTEGTTFLSWMAWTWPTAAFFLFIFLCLAGMSVWEYYSPGGDPRHGIFLAWLGIFGTPLWGPLVIALAYAFVVFRWV